MRAWALLAILALLATPVALAQDDVRLAPGTYHATPMLAQEGSRYVINVTSDVAVDVLLVNGTDDTYVAGTGGTQRIVERLDTTEARVEGAFPSAGRWTLIVDNSPRPAGGANGTDNATFSADVVVRHPLPQDPPQAAPDDPAGSRDPWPVLMLTAPYWDLDAVGLGGMALWFVVLGVVAALGYREGWSKVAVLALGAAGLVAAWSLVPGRGPVMQVGFPLLVAAGVAWVAFRGSSDGRQGARMAFLAGGLGALLGLALGHLLRALWSDPGMMLLGADRFDDPVFILPVAAGLGALLVAVLSALAEASTDEEPEPVPERVPLGATFVVQCLRCATPIRVDRSMKRYRVATDRFEFPCPNCHAWMEWAEPKPEGAAAA